MAAKKRERFANEEPENHAFRRLFAEEGFDVGDAPTTGEQEDEGDAGAAGGGAGPTDLTAVGKAVVRKEKKGRRGKTVTLVRLDGIAASKLEPLARRMRKGLGCGSWVEEGYIVLQGDLTERAAAWLEAEGVHAVSRG
ncbi:MAG: translation initiation factor [Synergistales bacterium]|nr:translation initiation factor [Synergistales bacterium]